MNGVVPYMKLKDMAAVPVVTIGAGVGSTGSSFLQATKVMPINTAMVKSLVFIRVLIVDVVRKTEDYTFLVRHHQRS